MDPALVIKMKNCCLLRIAFLKSLVKIFSSTYACETLFSSLNCIKDENRNRLTDDVSSACVLIKNSNYEPNNKELPAGVQHHKINE